MNGTVPIVARQAGIPAASFSVDTPGAAEAANPKPRRTRRSLLTMVAIVVGLVIGAIILERWWTVGRFLEQTDDAYVGGEITVIAPKVPGFITAVLVKDNQEVHAGDLLVRLDDRDYRARQEKAEGEIAAEQAQIANLDAERSLQVATIDQTRAEIAMAGADLELAGADNLRFQDLLTRKVVSIQNFQQTNAAYKKAVASDQKSHSAFDTARLQLAVIAAQRNHALAALKEAQADLDLAGIELGETEIHAPIDGVVGNRSARVGAYATTGLPLLNLVPTRGLWVDANFKETQIGRMRPGQLALVYADVAPGEVFKGRVESLAPATGAEFSLLPPENATGNFTKIVQRVPVRIHLEDDGASLGRLRPGLSVTAEVERR